MFRETYHQANDDIPINRDLLENILNMTPKKNKYFYPRIAIAASVLILSATVLSYPQFKNNFNRDNNIGIPMISVPTPVQLDLADIVPTTEPELKTEHIDADNNKIDTSAANDTKKVSPNVAKDKKTFPVEKQDSHSYSQTIPASEEEPVAQTQTLPPDIPVNNTAINEANSPETPTESPDISQASVLGATSDKDTRDSFITENWTKKRYFEYLGTEITPTLPTDLSDISVTEKNMTLYSATGIPCYDTWSWKYESDDHKRAVTIKTTKNTTETENIISQSTTCTDIGNIKTLITHDAKFTYAKAVKNNISYTIDSMGLSDEEFTVLCSSILK